jgi:hypothetical protein
MDAMKPIARIFAVVLLAAFAASTVAHAASITTMSLSMSLADTGDEDMADCTGCPGQSKAMSCDLPCTAPFAATAAAQGSKSPALQSELMVAAATHAYGRTGPPEPYPPREAHA